MRIVIAEDDFTSRNMLVAILKKNNYEVVEAADGAEAWNVLKEPDAAKLAILDWMMPDMDGLEVVRRVRAQKSDLPPYIIMLTTKGEKTDIVAGLEAGADDYLSKPFDTGELLARVQVGKRMVEMQDALIQNRKDLEHEATHDPLTGLLNRRAILDRLHGELARAQRHGDLLAAGMCDLDHFKEVNDTYGHQTGDDVLREISRILEMHCREYDYVGRMGGEEFLIITPMKTGDPKSIFERLCKQIAESNISTRSGTLSITISIGVACTDTESTMDGILGAADMALYRAKAGGRNCVVFATESVE